MFSVVIDLLDTLEIINPASFDEFVWHQYIMHQRTDVVAKTIDGLGIRLRTRTRLGSRKFKHTDVTDLIIKDIDTAKNPLQLIAYVLYKHNFSDYSDSKACKELRALKTYLFTCEFNIFSQPLADMQINQALYSRDKSL